MTKRKAKNPRVPNPLKRWTLWLLAHRPTYRQAVAAIYGRDGQVPNKRITSQRIPGCFDPSRPSVPDLLLRLALVGEVDRILTSSTVREIPAMMAEAGAGDLTGVATIVTTVHAIVDQISATYFWRKLRIPGIINLKVLQPVSMRVAQRLKRKNRRSDAAPAPDLVAIKARAAEVAAVEVEKIVGRAQALVDERVRRLVVEDQERVAAIVEHGQVQAAQGEDVRP